MALLCRYQRMLLQIINSAKKVVKKRHQLTLPQAILAHVIRAMMYYLLLVRLINVKQFVMQLRQLTRLQAILVIV
jgi:hypothetical protein